MPIEVVCPECDKTLRVRDELEGKKVRCPGCQATFPVRRVVVAEPEEERVRPQRRRAQEEVRPARRRPADDEDERPARRRGRAHDEEEEEDERPARRAKKGSPVALIVVLLVGFFLLAGVGVGGFFIYRAVRAKDGGTAQNGGKGGGLAGPPVKMTRIELEDGPGVPNYIHAPRPDSTHVVVLRGALLGAGAGAPRRLERYDVSTGKRAHSMDLKEVTGTAYPAGVSPDAALVVFRHLGGWPGLEATGVNVVLGTPVFRQWKPAYPKGAQTVNGRGLLVLDSTRVLVVYEDDAVDVWTFTAAGPPQRQQVRAASFPGPGRPTDSYFALSPDGKTLAFWNGDGFDLIDPTAGASRGKTGGLDLLPGEKSVSITSPLFSPDGKRILAEVRLTGAPASQRLLARWDAAAGQKGVRLDVKEFLSVQWWGNDHLYVFWSGGGAGGFATRGQVYEAGAGKRLCAITFDSVATATLSRDGKLWIPHRRGIGGKTALLGVPFPEAEVKALPAPSGDVPSILEIKPDGVSPLTKR